MNITTEENRHSSSQNQMVEEKANFKSQHGQNLTCNFCPEDEPQFHLVFGKKITKDIDMYKLKLENIYKDITKQEKAEKELQKILKQRNIRFKIPKHIFQ